MNKNYKDHFTHTLTHEGTEYELRSQNGCFWDVFVDGELVFENFTSKWNAHQQIQNDTLARMYMV